ncbi:hypothetical protein ACH5RR_021803 [Cinchona calisaya]|uniref:Uncharacterized protein n=1 Tax=Cinchona calisaya TaxID=153742 RepID=A0ABD2ZJB2_9GENT
MPSSNEEQVNASVQSLQTLETCARDAVLNNNCTIELFPRVSGQEVWVVAPSLDCPEQMKFKSVRPVQNRQQTWVLVENLKDPCIEDVLKKHIFLHEMLMDDHHSMDRPWLVGKDFNVVSSILEYLGFSVQNLNAMLEFNDAMSDFRLSQLPYSGSNFTWSRVSNGWVVWKHLDTIVVNIE